MLDGVEEVTKVERRDGRRPSCDHRTAFSYQMQFDTKADEWIEVKLPVDKFVAHSFGRPIPTMKLEPFSPLGKPIVFHHLQS